jgi:hypothetical protein
MQVGPVDGLLGRALRQPVHAQASPDTSLADLDRDHTHGRIGPGEQRLGHAGQPLAGHVNDLGVEDVTGKQQLTLSQPAIEGERGHLRPRHRQLDVVVLKGHHRVPPDQRADAPATADRCAAHGRMVVVSDLDCHVDKVADDIAVRRADVRTEQIAQQHRRHRPSVRRPATRGANVSKWK